MSERRVCQLICWLGVGSWGLFILFCLASLLGAFETWPFNPSGK